MTVTAGNDHPGAPDTDDQIVWIRPPRGWGLIDIRELWRYRDLLYFLVWRDIKVRYKQTALGAAWAVLVPFLTMVVFSIFFGRLAKMPSDGLPYPLFSYAALVPWTFFVQSLTQGAGSVVANQTLITKVYFPRAAIPIAAVFAGVVDFAVALGVLFVMMAFYGVAPRVQALWALPLLFLLAMMTVLAVSMWLAALHVKYRDIKYTIPFLSQLWLFITPIAYPSSLLTEPWRTVYGLNPMAGVVEGFRWALLRADTAPGPIVFVSAAAALVLLITGSLYFSRTERAFADIV